VAILWGNSAKELAKFFREESLVTGVHPSPLSAHRGFLGSKPFSKVNEILESKNRSTINW
jgi:uracil-DNA glycosylase